MVIKESEYAVVNMMLPVASWSMRFGGGLVMVWGGISRIANDTDVR